MTKFEKSQIVDSSLIPVRNYKLNKKLKGLIKMYFVFKIIPHVLTPMVLE